MTNVDIQNVQAELLRRVSQNSGSELIQLCQDGRPIGVIRFLGGGGLKSAAPRPIGLDVGTFTVPPEFFDPLPDDLLAAFNGEGP